MTGDRTQNKVSTGTKSFIYIFCCFFPIKSREQSDISTYLPSNVMMRSSLIWFTLDVEKKELGRKHQYV